MGQFIGFPKGKASLPQSAPVLKATLSEDVRLFLLAALPSDEAGLRSVGCEDCVDHPTCPGHKYMEGYFHSVSSSWGEPVVDSVHPRMGYSVARRPAPTPLFAFCEAFRRANAELFTNMKTELAAFPTAGTLANVLESQRHFADLSVQVHWGDEVASENVAWHKDAPNSFLHLALGLSGSRALHARRSVVNGRVPGNCLIGEEDEREVLWQKQGDAYLSVPCCFPHAVQYPPCDWDERVVAVQIRLFLSEEELFGMMGKQHTALDVDPKGGTAAIVFRQLAAQGDDGLCLPSLEDVQRVLAEHEQIQAACLA